MSATCTFGEAPNVVIAEFGEPAWVVTLMDRLPLAAGNVATARRVCATVLRSVVTNVPLESVFPPAVAKASPAPVLVKETGVCGTTLA